MLLATSSNEENNFYTVSQIDVQIDARCLSLVAPSFHPCFHHTSLRNWIKMQDSHWRSQGHCLGGGGWGQVASGEGILGFYTDLIDFSNDPQHNWGGRSPPPPAPPPP